MNWAHRRCVWAKNYFPRLGSDQWWVMSWQLLLLSCSRRAPLPKKNIVLLLSIVNKLVPNLDRVLRGKQCSLACQVARSGPTSFGHWKQLYSLRTPSDRGCALGIKGICGDWFAGRSGQASLWNPDGFAPTSLMCEALKLQPDLKLFLDAAVRGPNVMLCEKLCSSGPCLCGCPRSSERSNMQEKSSL